MNIVYRAVGAIVFGVLYVYISSFTTLKQTLIILFLVFLLSLFSQFEGYAKGREEKKK
jgi:hypothetical protein